MTGAKNENGLTWIWIVGFAAFAVLHRLVPYLFDLGTEARYAWNFAPVGAVGLFAGVRGRSPLSVLTPLAVMLVSDLLLWPFLSAKGYATFTWGTPLLYGSFVVYALIGRLVRQTEAPLWITAAPFLGALQFFLVTNFAVWLGGDGVVYAKNLTGLGHCFVMALPFFPATLGGDLLYAFLFFGLHGLSLYVFQARKVGQPA